MKLKAYLWAVFNGKNNSPFLLASFTSLVISFLSGLLSFFFTNSYLKSLITFGITALVTYALVYFVLEKFIYRKIKLIYKFISNTKATKREEFFTQQLLPAKTLEEVQYDVEQWALAKKQEIEHLQGNDTFRKEFILNLTHELKTPIFAVQNYIETLLDGAAEKEEIRKEFLEKASNNVNRLVNLVEDLDQISKYESNRIELHKEKFIIQTLIKQVFADLQYRQKDKNTRFTFKPGCEKDIWVYADKNKIEQVLINLVENSIKYGKENGETSAGIYSVDNKTVLVEINDNGLGIAEEHVPRVFERFYRTDLARSRKVGGSGLGLSIVKHIIEAHKGNVHCRSTPDLGTTVGFTLPNA